MKTVAATSTDTKVAAEEGAEAVFKRLLEDIDYGELETEVQAGTSRASTIIAAAENSTSSSSATARSRP